MSYIYIYIYIYIYFYNNIGKALSYNPTTSV